MARIAAASLDPELRAWWPQPAVDAILRLWEERDAFCTALERLPQTFCHGDAIRRNLLGCRGADGALYAVGGTDLTVNKFGTVEKYNPQTDAWSTVSSLGSSRSGHGAALGSDNRLYMLGGYVTNSTKTLSVEAVSATIPTWRTLIPFVSRTD